MSETTQKESNGAVNDSKSPKDEKEKKSSVAFNDMLTNRMQVEEENVPSKGSSKLSSSSKSKIKLLVGGIVFVILIIIIIVLMIPKTPKQNDYQLWRLTKGEKGQRWKLDNNKKLENKEGVWKSDDLWIFKSKDDDLIYIENTSKTKVLKATGDGKVIEEVLEEGKAEQLWKKGELDAEGYFTLENSGVPKVLTAISESSWEIIDLAKESKLENLYSSSWEFEDNIWTIPSDDGYIEVKNSKPGKVLAINGEEVILEDKAEKSKSSQLWIKGSENSDGYFSLKNKETEKFLTVFTYTSRLWSLTNDSRLNNLYSSEWDFQDNQWTIPTESTEEGFIEVKEGKSNSGKVLAITESEVVLEDKVDNSTSSQIWIKGTTNSDGYFTLKNKGTGEFLQGDRTPMTSVKDFIFGEDFDGSLGVGSSYGINVGGAGALDAPDSDGVKGCTGKLMINPPFKKGDIEKTTEDGFVFTAWIYANKNKDKYRTKKITVQGTCCWGIYHRSGASQKDLKPGQILTPSVAYIRKLKTKKC